MFPLTARQINNTWYRHLWLTPSSPSAAHQASFATQETSHVYGYCCIFQPWMIRQRLYYCKDTHHAAALEHLAPTFQFLFPYVPWCVAGKARWTMETEVVKEWQKSKAKKCVRPSGSIFSLWTSTTVSFFACTSVLTDGERERDRQKEKECERPAGLILLAQSCSCSVRERFVYPNPSLSLDLAPAPRHGDEPSQTHTHTHEQDDRDRSVKRREERERCGGYRTREEWGIKRCREGTRAGGCGTGTLQEAADRAMPDRRDRREKEVIRRRWSGE